jgi:hypothetical protein
MMVCKRINEDILLSKCHLKRSGQKSRFILSTLLPFAWFDSIAESVGAFFLITKIISHAMLVP